MQPPLFPSDCEFAQLLTIFQILGTPTEETWPGVTDLKDWHLYPQWPAVDMVKYMEGVLDPVGVDLLMQMLRYDPHKRISVRTPHLPTALNACKLCHRYLSGNSALRLPAHVLRSQAHQHHTLDCLLRHRSRTHMVCVLEFPLFSSC